MKNIIARIKKTINIKCPFCAGRLSKLICLDSKTGQPCIECLVCNRLIFFEPVKH
jgi:hypothetical protein